jgi:aromatic-L-amino-acid decarboxylase
VIAEHLTTLPEKPVFRPFAAELAVKCLDSKPPELGQEADDILATFAPDIEPYPFGNGHPRFYGWVNSPPVVLGIFAEAFESSEPELRWRKSRGHLGRTRGNQLVQANRRLSRRKTWGLLVSGGSIATLTGLAVARQAQCGFDIRTRGVQRTSSIEVLPHWRKPWLSPEGDRADGHR